MNKENVKKIPPSDQTFNETPDKCKIGHILKITKPTCTTIINEAGILTRIIFCRSYRERKIA
jgi:hypothetical protein